jgi:hypothetical protein
MPENLFNTNHKCSNKLYRDGWDRIFKKKNKYYCFEGGINPRECTEEEFKDRLNKEFNEDVELKTGEVINGTLC